MKHIAIWKVLLLTIITLGIYFVVWSAKRRDELIATQDRAIPTWLWLIIPAIIAGFGGLIALVIGLILLAGNPEAAWIFVHALVLTVFFVPFLISLWWVWRFAEVAADETKGRITKGWIFALYLLTGGFVAVFLQYYFNRPVSKKHVPSKHFLAIAPLACFVFLLMNIWSAVDVYPKPGQFEEFSKEMSLFQQEIKTIQQ